jgi:hypothetical protein
MPRYYKDKYIVQVNGKWQKREEDLVQHPGTAFTLGDDEKVHNNLGH